MTQRLRIVEGTTAAEVPVARAPDLASRPFRPGELPRRLVLELDGAARRRAEWAAAATGVPLGLWVRVAVEASRHVMAASAISGIATGSIISAVTKRATTTSAPPNVCVEARELGGYARALECAAARSPDIASASVGVDVNDECAVSWTAAATAAGRTVDAWVAEMLGGAPDEAIAWEAAAARAGATLGEFVYAEALRIASAAPSA